MVSSVTTGRPAGARTAWTLSVYFTINTLLFSIFILKNFKHKRKHVSVFCENLMSINLLPDFIYLFFLWEEGNPPEKSDLNISYLNISKDVSL